jgi:hypothetical protein
MTTPIYNINVDNIRKANNVVTSVQATQYNTYTVFNYDKDYVCYDDAETGMYKSVIMDASTNEIYCMAPPKSVTYDQFVSSNPTLSDDIVVTEIIPGIMINLWYDNAAARWEISTRDCIGCTEDVRAAFLVAFGNDPEITSDINDDPFLKSYPNSAPKNVFSFVLDLVRSPTPKLYLVGQYIIENNTVFDIYHTTDHKDTPFVSFPHSWQFPNYQDLKTHFQTIQGSKDIMGVMLCNKKTGQRVKFFNQAYLDFMELQNTDACLLYQYLTLRYVDKVKCTSFDNIPDTTHCTKILDKFIQNLLDSYKARYVKRTGEIISQRYMPWIYKMHHNIYLPSLQGGSPNKTVVTKAVINDYLNRLAPTDVFHALYSF